MYMLLARKAYASNGLETTILIVNYIIVLYVCKLLLYYCKRL